MGDSEVKIKVTANVTLDDLAQRMDMFGEQMNWLCDNMQSLFQFVSQMGQNGGGIRGLLSAMKKGAPELTDSPVESEVT